MNKNGFLLLEVILSILIVSVGLVVVTFSFSMSKKLLFQSRALFHTSLLLRERLFEIEEKNEIAQTPKNGSWDDEPYTWKLQVNSVADTKMEHVLLEVDPSDKPGGGYTVETYLKAEAQ